MAYVQFLEMLNQGKKIPQPLDSLTIVSEVLEEIAEELKNNGLGSISQELMTKYEEACSDLGFDISLLGLNE